MILFFVDPSGKKLQHSPLPQIPTSDDTNDDDEPVIYDCIEDDAVHELPALEVVSLFIHTITHTLTPISICINRKMTSIICKY